MKTDYSKAYPVAYNVLLEVDEKLFEMPFLDNAEVDEQIEKIHNEINRLFKIVRKKVEEQDKENYQKLIKKE